MDLNASTTELWPLTLCKCASRACQQDNTTQDTQIEEGQWCQTSGWPCAQNLLCADLDASTTTGCTLALQAAHDMPRGMEWLQAPAARGAYAAPSSPAWAAPHHRAARNQGLSSMCCP